MWPLSCISRTACSLLSSDSIAATRWFKPCLKPEDGFPIAFFLVWSWRAITGLLSLTENTQRGCTAGSFSWIILKWINRCFRWEKSSLIYWISSNSCNLSRSFSCEEAFSQTYSCSSNLIQNLATPSFRPLLDRETHHANGHRNYHKD